MRLLNHHRPAALGILIYNRLQSFAAKLAAQLATKLAAQRAAQLPARLVARLAAWQAEQLASCFRNTHGCSSSGSAPQGSQPSWDYRDSTILLLGIDTGVLWMTKGQCRLGPIDARVVTGTFLRSEPCVSWATARIFLGQNGVALRSPISRCTTTARAIGYFTCLRRGTPKVYYSTSGVGFECALTERDARRVFVRCGIQR